MGFLILVRRHLYIESGPRICLSFVFNGMATDALAPYIIRASAVMILTFAISESFEGLKLVFRFFKSFWNLAGTSAALNWISIYCFQIILKFGRHISSIELDQHLLFSNHSEICRHISSTAKFQDDMNIQISNTQYCCFETLQDLVIRRLSSCWNGLWEREGSVCSVLIA